MLPRHPGPRHRSCRKLHAPRSSVSLVVPEERGGASSQGARWPGGSFSHRGALQGPGGKEALCSLVGSCTSGAPARRGVPVARAAGGTCVGGARGGGSATGQGHKSERESWCAHVRQLRHRWPPGAPRHKGCLDVAATGQLAKGKRKTRARRVSGWRRRAALQTRAVPGPLLRGYPGRARRAAAMAIAHLATEYVFSDYLLKEPSEPKFKGLRLELALDKMVTCIAVGLPMLLISLAFAQEISIGKARARKGGVA